MNKTIKRVAIGAAGLLTAIALADGATNAHAHQAGLVDSWDEISLEATGWGDQGREIYESEEALVRDRYPLVAQALADSRDDIDAILGLVEAAPPDPPLPAGGLGTSGLATARAGRECRTEQRRVWLPWFRGRMDAVCTRLEGEDRQRSEGWLWRVSAAHFSRSCEAYRVFADDYPVEERRRDLAHAARGAFHLAIHPRSARAEPEYAGKAKVILDRIEERVEGLATREACREMLPGLAEPLR